MMHNRRISALAASFLLGACMVGGELPDKDEPTGPVLRPDATKPQSPYYAVRRDLRLCPAPHCGGYWISLVNRDTTPCADGSRAEACYVAELVLPDGVRLDEGDLVYGKQSLRAYPELDLELGVFEASAVLSPVLTLEAQPGSHYLAYDTGVRCIRSPCPSLAAALLNQEHAGSLAGHAFVADSEREREALANAFSDELGSRSALGQGAVSLGRLRGGEGQQGATLEVHNVYVEKLPQGPVCVVSTQPAAATAWNFASAEEGRAFADGLPGNVQLIEGPCSEALLACTREYAPVHGTIDALGAACVAHGNACEFRAAVIHAAGTSSKASGSWEPGLCPDASDACEEDSDCDEGFCGWDADGERICRPWAELGEHCEGFVLPQDRRFCAPDLTCRYLEPTGDAGGVCLLPDDRFPCGDQGLTCDYASEYCFVTLGGVPLPDGSPSISYSCANAGACVGLDATCACLQADDPLLGMQCEDHGLLPPTVTLFAP